jgi:hypothetical protein
MNYKTISAAVALMLLAATASQANAAPVIDTGTPTDFSSPLSLGGSSWIAGEINFAQASQIQSIGAYVNDMGYGGTFTIALYNETASHLPDAASPLNSWTATFSGASSGWDWTGVSNLNQAVAAGKYWVALEVQGSDTFSGSAAAAATPLAKYAFNDGGYAGYQAMSQSFSLQVTAVPEPEQLALMLAGLGLIGATLRRKTLTIAV